MAFLTLNLLTPSGIVFEGEATYVSLPSSKGVLGLLPNHTPLIAELAPKGVLRVVNGDAEKYFAISYGAIEVKKEKTIVLTEKAIEASSLDEAKELLKNPPFVKKMDKDIDVKTAEYKIKKSLENGK